MNKKTMSPQEVAAYLQISVKSVLRHVEKGHMECHIPFTEVRRFLDERRVPALDEAERPHSSVEKRTETR